MTDNEVKILDYVISTSIGVSKIMDKLDKINEAVNYLSSVSQDKNALQDEIPVPDYSITQNDINEITANMANSPQLVKDGDFVTLFGMTWQKFTMTDYSQPKTERDLGREFPTNTALHLYNHAFVSCFGETNDYEKSTLKLAFEGWKLAQTELREYWLLYDSIINNITIPTKDQYEQMIRQGLDYDIDWDNIRWTMTEDDDSGRVFAAKTAEEIVMMSSLKVNAVSPLLWLNSELKVTGGKGTLEEPWEVEL